MDFEKIKYVYLIGIGGIGMSALARYFLAKGKHVSGYDKTSTPLTSELISEGITISFTDDINSVPIQLSGAEINNDVLVIYTPAIPENHVGKNYLLNAGYQLYKRSEILGLISENTYTIAVAGTHGKTTTSCMVAHILKSSGVECTAFFGGISNNYNSNFLLSSGSGNETMVVEADEYDKSFLNLNPDIAVITSVDPDHLDVYGDESNMLNNYKLFSEQVKKNGFLIYKKGLPFEKSEAINITYSIDELASTYATGIRIENHFYKFDINYSDECFKNFKLTWPGRHNVENALAAFAVAKCMGIDTGSIRNALETFTGVKRRFDYRVRNDNVIYIDDYAHHPKELDATISSVRELYPGKKVMGIFQPHLYSRTRDLVNDFAESLSKLDQVVMLEIYPAREEPIEGVSSSLILDKIIGTNKSMSDFKNVENLVVNADADVILTLGAGDIDTLVTKIENILNRKYPEN